LHHLARRRLREGARLLRESDHSLAEIAGRVGYRADAAFSRAFKRWAGVAPGAYRRGAPAGPADAHRESGRVRYESAEVPGESRRSR